jgi:hypothetical protein
LILKKIKKKRFENSQLPKFKKKNNKKKKK